MNFIRTFTCMYVKSDEELKRNFPPHTPNVVMKKCYKHFTI